ncbi:MAG: N-acetylmuramoyl-L-alanine amidase [Hyphomicrobiales bacterium]
MIRSPLAHRFVLSPNIEPRRGNVRPDMIVLHYTGMDNAAAARDWLCDARSNVSCHYLVDEDGEIAQMVGEEMRAWHAGVSVWEGDTDINSRSIGIEIHNPGHLLGYRDFPAAQMEAVIALCRDIAGRHDVEPRHVLAHSDVAPSRKIDPGEKFDWQRLHAAGIGHWVAPSPLRDGPDLQVGGAGDRVAALQAKLARYGYGIEVTARYDAPTRAVIQAFQRHFRPARIDGIADPSTVETLDRLIAASGLPA